MAVSDEYRVKAAECRALAKREQDRLFRVMFERLAKTYSQLADLADEVDRNDRDVSGLPYELSPPVAAGDPAKR